MADETPAELRWLTERIDRNHAETSADIARLETQVAGIPASMERYVLQRVYDADEKRRTAEREADRGRIAQLEANDTTQAAGGRAWVIGVGLAVVGALLGYISQVMQARGH